MTSRRAEVALDLLYTIVLFLHSYLRWIIVLLAVLVFARSFGAWLRGRGWLPSDDRMTSALLRSMDLQFLLGLLLYAWLSPFSYAFFANMAGGMKEPILRFYGVEHIVGMFIAVALLHGGIDGSKKAPTPTHRHRRIWIVTLLAILIMFASIPWPNRPGGRPLFRGISEKTGDAPTALMA